jgi:hypothetical protein
VFRGSIKKPKFKGETTYDHDFIEKHMPEETVEGPAVEYHRPVQKMVGETIYDRDFPGHEIDPNDHIQAQPAKFRRSPGKFQGTTTYDQDFIEHEADLEHEQPIATNYVRESSPPLQRETNYMRDYPGHSIKAKQVQEPEEIIEIRERRVRKPKFTGKSTYDKDFQEFEIEPEQEEYDTRHLQIERSPGKFAGKTSYNDDFLPHEIKPETQEHIQVARANPGKFRG